MTIREEFEKAALESATKSAKIGETWNGPLWAAKWMAVYLGKPEVAKELE